ncbi:MAG: hypothetical protein ACLT0Y_07410 [Christensenellales bacterium]
MQQRLFLNSADVLHKRAQMPRSGNTVCLSFRFLFFVCFNVVNHPVPLPAWSSLHPNFNVIVHFQFRYQPTTSSESAPDPQSACFRASRGPHQYSIALRLLLYLLKHLLPLKCFVRRFQAAGRVNFLADDVYNAALAHLSALADGMVKRLAVEPRALLQSLCLPQQRRAAYSV